VLFNSLIFVVFFIVFFSLWPLAKQNNKIRWSYICILSFVFYGWWDWRFLFLLLGTGYIDFITGKYIYQKPKFAKLLLIISLATNLASLVFFKYSGFIAKQLDFLFLSFNQPTTFYESIPEFSLVLPVGISFYTFNSMSYTIDIYRKQLKPVESIIQFFAFISFFPHLVAGPIIRAKDILKQLEKNVTIQSVQIWHAIKLIVIGFFYKVVIADGIATFVNTHYLSYATNQSSLLTWFWVMGFSIQIYCDFAGYSIIAKGIAKLCGIQFKMNFNHPYLANSLKDFWNRWHISLSHWFRDYVYFTLGGNKTTKLKSHVNMIATMIISGIWHGANFTFIIWGAIHAFFLTFERLFKLTLVYRKNLVLKALGFLFVLFQVQLAWVFFRANNISDGFLLVENLFCNSFKLSAIKPYFFDIVIFVIGFTLIELVQYLKGTNTTLKLFLKKPLNESVAVGVMLFMIVFFHGPQIGFIYFQF
jgi:alginate O-acetyltransferase complex protein AlgI